MTFNDLKACQRICLTSCYSYLRFYRCRNNLTSYSLVVYAIYVLLFLSILLGGFVIYGKYKRKNGYLKEKVGPCCYKYQKDPKYTEMRQVIYIGDEDGAITQVGQNFVLVPTNEARKQQNVTTLESSSNTEQLQAPNTAPQF